MSRLLRVTQLDAIQLDEEILNILKITVENATKYLTPGLTTPFEPEINLLIKLLVLGNSVVKNNCTFGQQLLLVKYNNLTDMKKLLYVILSSSSYLKERCELWKPSHMINRLFDKVDGLWKILNFINLSIFLYSGKTPRFIDRILGLEQIYSRKIVQRNFQSKYLTRELLWNGFIELLVFVLPLINYHKMKRNIRQLNPFYKKNMTSKRTNKRIFNLYSKCPHCHENPIQPHHMGCAHVFCYICLQSNLQADLKYECPLCGHSGEKCEILIV